MRWTNATRSWAVASAAALVLAGCPGRRRPVLVRGAASLDPAGGRVGGPATVERAAAATNQAFDQLKVRQVKSQVEQGRMGGEAGNRGTAGDREVSFTLQGRRHQCDPRAGGSERTAVTWDKDFARSRAGPRSSPAHARDLLPPIVWIDGHTTTRTDARYRYSTNGLLYGDRVFEGHPRL